MEETSTFKTTSFKQGKRINKQHKKILFLVQVLYSNTRDPMQGNTISELF